MDSTKVSADPYPEEPADVFVRRMEAGVLRERFGEYAERTLTESRFVFLGHGVPILVKDRNFNQAKSIFMGSATIQFPPPSRKLSAIDVPISWS